MSVQEADIWGGVRAAEASGNLSLIRAAYQEVVTKVPDLPAAWLKLGQASLLEGSYRNALDATLEAANAMRRASRWQALPHVGRQLLRFDERRLVRELIEEADWNNPLLLSESAVLAQQLWLVGADDVALAFLEHAMRRLPAHHLLHYSKAEVLSHLGRLEESEIEHELAIKLNPMFSMSHRALAYLHPTQDSGPRIERIKEILRTAGEGIGVEDRIDLHYALFKELDGIDAVDEAWEHLSAGAGLRRANQTYDQGRESRGIDALIRDGSRAQVAELDVLDDGGAAARHVFVVGMPRSGTTVLDRMLGNHSDMVSAGELNVFARSLSWAIDRFYEPPVTEAIVQAAVGLDDRTVAARYGEATEYLRAGRKSIIDKNPLNISNAGFIARSMPDARIICMVRDPMDTCFSNLKEPFSPGAYGYSYSQDDLANHYADFRRLAAHFEQTHPKRFKAVSYEELVAQPRAQLEEVMAFCGGEYQQGQEDLARNQSPVSTASKAQVRKPLNRNGIGAWRRYAGKLEPLRRRLEAQGFA